MFCSFPLLILSKRPCGFLYNKLLGLILSCRICTALLGKAVIPIARHNKPVLLTDQPPGEHLAGLAKQDAA